MLSRTSVLQVVSAAALVGISVSMVSAQWAGGAGNARKPGSTAATDAPTPPTGAVPQAPQAEIAPKGYYRQPAIWGETIVFVAEGDLWEVAKSGGVATRLTSHPGDELRPNISPDGKWIAFTGQYEGPTEVYVMPLHGGLPVRLTFDASRASVVGWTPDGRVMATTDKYSTLPNQQLLLINPSTRARELVELAQVSDGAFDPSAKSLADARLMFVRIPFNGSFTKRYKGGTIQQVWTFKKGDAEAVNLTGDFTGTSKRPMWGGSADGGGAGAGRVFFLTDRDGTMNIWSMATDGKDLKQHTKHAAFDVMDAGIDRQSGSIIAYQHQADIWTLDVATGQSSAVNIMLNTDLDQMRERWVEKPMDWMTAAHISPTGDHVVLTARGRVFVVPTRQGRVVDVARDDGVRYRNARFWPSDDENVPARVVALSDRTGEVEVWSHPANGVGDGKQLTSGARVLRWEAVPSPDGRYIAHWNKDQELYVFDSKAEKDTRIDTSQIDDFSEVAWSPDSGWLAYVTQADNMFKVIRIWSAESGMWTQVTTDRYDSYSPAWSVDGKWLYFLSDRTLRTMVSSPWGSNQPDPFLNDTTKIYAIALKSGQRWPFQPSDEVQIAKERAEKQKEKDKKQEPEASGEKKPDASAAETKPETAKDKSSKKVTVEVELERTAARLYEVPVKAGNYSNLSVLEKGLLWVSTPASFDRKNDLQGIEIKNDGAEVKTVLADIAFYEPSQDGKKLLVRKGDTLYVIDAGTGPASELDKKAVNLGGWSLSFIPRHQWRAMFIESWRLMRDYFYDPNMHGVDWRGMLDKYLPLVDRVTTRAELNDIISQMVGELSALHHFVRGGDLRSGVDSVQVAALGGVLVRDDVAGGWRVTKIYECEPDDPARVSPLAKPSVGIQVGDVIELLDGIPTLSVPDYAVLLRQKAGRQVLLRVKPANAAGGFDASRDAIIVPISQESENDLRYTDWQYSRRKMVEEWGGGKIGYVHLRAMGGEDFTSWVKSFYPIFNREGLIIDVRHNRGGNIDSWILSKLMRKAWFFWSPRIGNPPTWNMQYAFRGHMVCLCNERTASDGEAFADGFKRLGLGKVIGTRTWGGEIWLSSSNILVDRGLASAGETGVYGPDGDWLIEGHGVDPDIVVDNPPHATFKGEDAQLKAAVEHLKKQIADKPIAPVRAPAKPDKSFTPK